MRGDFLKMVLLAVLVALFGVRHASAGNITVVASYHPENAWTANCIQAIRERIGTKHAIDVIYMDTKRKPPSEHQEIADRTWKQIQKQKPDLIMTADDNALKYLAPEFEKIDSPVVFYGVNNNPRVYFKNGKIPENITGILERRMLIPLGRMIKNLVPIQKNRFLILFDDSQTTKAHLAITLHGKKNISFDGTTIEWQSHSYYDDWQNAVTRAAQTYDAIIVENWYTVKQRSTGQTVDANEVLTWTGQHSPVPVFGSIPHSVGAKKFIGAMVLTGSSHGRDAAKMALAILDEKKKPKDLTILTTKPDKYYFNQNNLQKFNLTLPANLQREAVFQ
ncbi:MAG: hypothetical protein HQM14_18005 [SAR324 cluster bacterium]|nr:hypothetical protein [SAR324 cluster bacterium]